jgi:hypothetical protein
MAAAGNQFKNNPAHNWLLSALQPCGELGVLGMNRETASLSELIAAHEKCSRVLEGLVKDYPHLFECPEGEPACIFAKQY